ncbi:MAG: hypothetical protein KDB56_02390 [Mycobacterium sp.]|nr:hypothetical protein [Mycobacterium sp.]
MRSGFAHVGAINLTGIPAAILAGGLALSAAVYTAPEASAACVGQLDPVTGNCWTVESRNRLGAANGAAGCRPGELGNCRAAQQNATRPRATLPSPADLPISSLTVRGGSR